MGHWLIKGLVELVNIASERGFASGEPPRLAKFGAGANALFAIPVRTRLPATAMIPEVHPTIPLQRLAPNERLAPNRRIE